MAAPKGNQLWKLRDKHGRSAKYETPEALWKACCQYFEWVEKNPLMAAETVKFQGTGQLMAVPKMRAMTQQGLCLFLGISQQTWINYRGASEGFFEVTSQVDAIMFEQKFTGAAADLLNPNIIARELGLADRQELTGKDGQALKVEHEINAADRLKSMVDHIAERSGEAGKPSAS